jgi:uncharacterized protein (TIGR02996 family)
MPVSVSLERLVSIPAAESLWPADFSALCKAVAHDPADRTPWLALADWLNDEGEADLEAACRYVAKRPDINVLHTRYNWADEWLFQDLPASVAACEVEGRHRSTLAGAIAELAAKLRKHASEGV